MNSPISDPRSTASAALYRDQLRRLFVRALLLRAALAVVLHLWVPEGVFAPDQGTYHDLATLASQAWSDSSPAPPLSTGPLGYVYVVAALYTVFGPYALVAKLMNSVLGAILVLVVADITRRLSDDHGTALRAARYVAYFPSLILWSALNIRDIWTILLIAVICRQVIILHIGASLRAVIVYAGAVLALIEFRGYLLYPVTLPAILALIVRGQRNIVRSTIVAGLLVGVVVYADQSLGANRKLRTFDLEELSETRYWMSVGASSSFGQVDISTPGKAALFLPVGLTYFVLAPFPWMVSSIRQVLAVPEMLFLYSLLPAMVAGLRYLLRQRYRISLGLVFVTAALTFGYALGEGNAGTAYRHRAQILPVLLVFAALGKSLRRRSAAPSIRLNEAADGVPQRGF